MRFSVFTPIYNRRDTIERVWKSLTAQTCRDFEWIVVDDASTDGVFGVLERYRDEAGFPVKIFRHERNRGKHVAWNLAARHARGELFVVADSDDAFVPEALARMEEAWLSIPDQRRQGYSGVNVLCKDAETGAIIGESYPDDPLDTHALELAYELEVRGEKWGCVRTDLIARHPFPEAAGTHFAENYVWFALARAYRTRCVNAPLRLFFDDPRPDRLTQERVAAVPRWKFEAAYLWNAFHLQMNADYIVSRPRELATTLVNLRRTGLALRRPFGDAWRRLHRSSLRALFLAFAPVGHALYLRDLARGRILDEMQPPIPDPPAPVERAGVAGDLRAEQGSTTLHGRTRP